MQPLRDRLVERLGGQPGLVGALVLADQVHLRRLVRGDVPTIVAVGCIHWYGAYRSDTDPDAQVVASLLELEDAWLRGPATARDWRRRCGPRPFPWSVRTPTTCST